MATKVPFLAMFQTEQLPLSVRDKTYSDINLNDEEWAELGFACSPFCTSMVNCHWMVYEAGRLGAATTRSFQNRNASSLLLPLYWEQYKKILLSKKGFGVSRQLRDRALAAGYYVIFYTKFFPVVGGQMFELTFKSDKDVCPY